MEDHIKNLKFIRRIEESSCATDRDKNVESLTAAIDLMEKIVEMNICEVSHVFLKVGQPYIFTIDMNCEKCNEESRNWEWPVKMG